jgi:16S rRNA (guanine527-N7)-methyltransferase
MPPRPRSSNQDGSPRKKTPKSPSRISSGNTQHPPSDCLNSTERELLAGSVEPLIAPADRALMLAQLEQYFLLLRQWNRGGNLISRGDESRVIERHAIDSLVTIPMLDEIRAGSLLDLGSGGGLPGIPIKILRPGIDVTLLDSRRMKTLFLLRAVNELGLSGVRVWRGRVEELGELPAGGEPERMISTRTSVGELEGPTRRPRFDAVVVRAVASLSVLAAWVAPLVPPGGHLLAYKGSRLDSEITAWECAPGPWRLAEIHRELRPQIHVVILQRG